MPLPQTPMVPVAKNNVIVVEVDNLLVNWPTYVFDFTPDQPGPVKIILRLKDATKRAQDIYMDDSDSEGERKEGTDHMDVDTTEKLRSRKASVMLNLIPPPAADMDCLYASSDDSESDDSDSTLTVDADAIPVILNGVVKDPPIPPKPKFLTQDIPWPPRRPRKAPQPISADKLLTRFSALMTHQASVIAVDSENSGDYGKAVFV